MNAINEYTAERYEWYECVLELWRQLVGVWDESVCESGVDGVLEVIEVGLLPLVFASQVFA